MTCGFTVPVDSVSAACIFVVMATRTRTLDIETKWNGTRTHFIVEQNGQEVVSIDLESFDASVWSVEAYGAGVMDAFDAAKTAVQTAQAARVAASNAAKTAEETRKSSQTATPQPKLKPTGCSQPPKSGTHPSLPRPTTSTPLTWATATSQPQDRRHTMTTTETADRTAEAITMMEDALRHFRLMGTQGPAGGNPQFVANLLTSAINTARWIASITD